MRGGAGYKKERKKGDISYSPPHVAGGKKPLIVTGTMRKKGEKTTSLCSEEEKGEKESAC